MALAAGKKLTFSDYSSSSAIGPHARLQNNGIVGRTRFKAANQASRIAKHCYFRLCVWHGSFSFCRWRSLKS